jgi:transcriptional regulator with XRE-family HTH domain
MRVIPKLVTCVGVGVKRLACVSFMRVGNETNPLTDLARRAAIDFGARVRGIRKARGLSQEDLAQALSDTGRSYHQTTVAKLESGTRPTSIEEVYVLAVLLDVPVSDLVVPDHETMSPHRQLRRLATEIARLTKDVKASTARFEDAKSEYEELAKSITLQPPGATISLTEGTPAVPVTKERRRKD